MSRDREIDSGPQRHLPPWLTAEQIMALLQISSRKTLDRWVEAKQFPPPVRCGVGRGILRWNRASVEKFLQEREAASVG